MDLDKLEKLSCLNIKESHKNDYQKSLIGVFDMMNSISQLTVTNDNDNLLIKEMINDLHNNNNSTVPSEMIERENHYEGIHLEQGVFLAPKVIKKN